MSSSGTQAEAARREFQELIEQKGHAVDNARTAIARLEVAFAEGALVRTGAVDQAITDLRLALEQDDGQKLGGKSAEAARFISRALARLIETA